MEINKEEAELLLAGISMEIHQTACRVWNETKGYYDPHVRSLEKWEHTFDEMRKLCQRALEIRKEIT